MATLISTVTKVFDDRYLVSDKDLTSSQWTTDYPFGNTKDPVDITRADQKAQAILDSLKISVNENHPSKQLWLEIFLRGYQSADLGTKTKIITDAQAVDEEIVNISQWEFVVCKIIKFVANILSSVFVKVPLFFALVWKAFQIQNKLQDTLIEWVFHPPKSLDSKTRDYIKSTAYFTMKGWTTYKMAHLVLGLTDYIPELQQQPIFQSFISYENRFSFAIDSVQGKISNLFQTIPAYILSLYSEGTRTAKILARARIIKDLNYGEWKACIVWMNLYDTTTKTAP